MKRSTHITVLLGLLFALIAISASRPEWISDSNIFLRDFVNHELLNILGVILAITLASISQIHLRLNEIEWKIKDNNQQQPSPPLFAGTRRELISSAKWLLGLFSAAAVLVLIKPLVACCGLDGAVVNSSAVWILTFNILILSDVTLSIFRIEF